MITDAILALAAGILSGLLDLVPEWSPNLPGVEQLMASAGGSAFMLNGYFPVATMLLSAGLLTAYQLFHLVWSLLNWIYEVMPGKMT